MGFFILKALFVGDPKGPSSKGIENTHLLSWEMVGTGMKILLRMSFLSRNLMGEGTITILRNKNIKEWKASINFLLLSELNG